MGQGLRDQNKGIEYKRALNEKNKTTHTQQQQQQQQQPSWDINLGKTCVQLIQKRKEKVFCLFPWPYLYAKKKKKKDAEEEQEKEEEKPKSAGF